MKDLGIVETLGAEAIGQPGQRRFRLFARAKGQAAILWMEKDQLLNLSLVIDRALAQVSDGRILRTEARIGGLVPQGETLPTNFPKQADFDFQVGQLRLSFEERRETFILIAAPYDVKEDENGEPQIILRPDDALALRFSIEQAQRLSSQITVLVSSGRPVCPLCQEPLDGGPHACIKQNGHSKIAQFLEEDEQEE